MIDSAKGKETSKPHVQPRSFTYCFDKKKTKRKNTESELIMMAQISEESRAGITKEKNIVLIGMREGTKVYERENQADEWIKTCDLIIKQIHIDSPIDLIEKVCRIDNRSGGLLQLLV